MKQYKTIILATALLLGACTKDIEYNGPDSERMLIVNCVAESGEIPVFKISHSAFFLDSYYSGNELTSGVTVSIDINGKTSQAAYSGELKGYTDGRAITEGDIISVTASDPDFGIATAVDTVPHSKDVSFSAYTKEYVPVKTMSELFDDYIYDFDPNTVDSVWVSELEIPVTDSKTGFYMITFEPSMTYFRYNDYEGVYDTLTERIHFKIPAETKILMGITDATTAVLEDTESDSQFEYGSCKNLFDDLYLKKGNKLSFEVLMESPDTLEYIYTTDEYGLSSISNPYSIADKIKDEVIYSVDIKLYVLSNAYYYYHKSVNDYRESDDDISFLSEPVTILHNVKGGAGILGTYTGKSFHIERTCKFK